MASRCQRTVRRSNGEAGVRGCGWAGERCGRPYAGTPVHPPGGVPSVAPVALLAPRVAVVVVAERLPEAGLVLRHEDEAAHPLGALPEVQMRDEQARGAAVLRLERLAVVLVDDP